MDPSHKYDIVFVSTFVDLKNINYLIDSICKASLNTDLNILLLIVCQNNLLIKFKDTKTVHIECLYKSAILPLSIARNVAIEYIMSRQIKMDFIMFPDDDSTFDETFFLNYKTCIKKKQNYLIDVYCTGTNKLFKNINSMEFGLLQAKNWHSACSVNMLISSESFFKVTFFDEMLGVGSKYGAGEDNDYFIRVCKVSNGFIYNKKMYNYHPAIKDTSQKYTLLSLVQRYKKYGVGVVAFLCKHAMFKDAFIICLRALLGSIKNLLVFNFRLSLAYLSSFYFRSKMFFVFLLKYRFIQ